MSRVDSWTLERYSDQIKALSGGWKTKLPFLNGTDHVKQMKKMQGLVDATIAVLGGNAGIHELKEIGTKAEI